jgi:alpha-ribazole phosphatase
MVDERHPALIRDIYLLRHGDTGFSGRYLGSTDVGLAKQGREQLKTVAETLAQIKFSRIFCSPMKRCLETLEEIKVTGELKILNDLREVDFGRWELASFPEIEANYAKEISAWAGSPHNFTFPGGEAVAAFRMRVKTAAQRCIATPGERILVVTHGGMCRHLICYFLGISMDQYLLFDVQCGKITILRLFGDQGGTIRALNLEK